MKLMWGLFFVFLMGCTTVPATMPTGQVVETHMDLCTASVGESCDTCRCLKPLKCLKGACAEVYKEDGSMCAYDEQCQSGSCVDLVCSRPESKAFNCQKVCPDYLHSQDECKTVCT